MFRRKYFFVLIVIFIVLVVSWQLILISFTLSDMFIGIPSKMIFQMNDFNRARIPPIIHQMWKTSNLSTYPINTSHHRWKEVYPDYQIRLWTDDDLHRLISSKKYAFLKRIYDSYPFAIQRADLARLLVLYDQGGIYADLDVFPSMRRSIDDLRLSGASFIIPRASNDQSLINHFLASESHSTVLNFILHRIPEKKFYQRIFLLPYLEVFSTGSIFLTRILRQWYRENRTNDDNQTLWIMSAQLVSSYVIHDAGRSWHLFDGYLLNQIDFYGRYLIQWKFYSFLFVCLFIGFLIKSRRWFRLVR